MAGKTKARVFFFSSQETLDEGIFLEGEDIRVRWNGVDECLLSVNDLQILGVHNYENAMAAAAAGICAGVPLDSLLSRYNSLRRQPSQHTRFYAPRRENFAESPGSYPGVHRHRVSFDDWTKLFPERVKHLVLIGATAPQIRASAEKFGFAAISDPAFFSFCPSALSPSFHLIFCRYFNPGSPSPAV